MIKKVSIAIVMVLMACSCNSDLRYKSELNQIKKVGDTNPSLAQRMLDSIKWEVRGCSDYVQMKYELLEIRLKDKLYINATSDIGIKRIVSYFNEHGSLADKREAYYYAGCVYRDLHDMPRSLEYYFRAQDVAEKERPCDSVMLRNTYSNLHCLYYNVQDFPNALIMARKEYTLSEKMHDLAASDAMHVGATLAQLDSIQSAEKYFVKAFKLSNQDDMFWALLYQFTYIGRMDMAKECYKKVKKFPKSVMAYLSLGNYFQRIEEKDSAAFYFTKVLTSNGQLEAQYDAAHHLFEMDNSNTKFAALFLKLCDSLNLGERQQRAATINNMHQYHRDMNIEQDMRREKESYRSMLIIVTLSLVLFVTLGALWYVYKRYKFQRRLIQQNEELKKLNESLELQRAKELSIKEDLSKSQSAYSRSQEEMGKVNAQLSQTLEELDLKKKELEERIEQTSDIMRMLHRSELTTTAEDVVNSIRAASEGKYNMNPSDWLRLYQAVDSLYPNFGDELVKKLKKFNEQQKQVCYLIRIGLTNTQIENVTDLSHATVWRWVKRYGGLIE